MKLRIAGVACAVMLLAGGPVAAHSRATRPHRHGPGSAIRLAIKAPTTGTWLNHSPASVIATVADRGSRIRKVTCNGRRARRKGRRVICKVPLRRGVNVIRVRAVDGSGRSRTVTRRVNFARGLLAGAASARALAGVRDYYDATVAVPPALTVLDGPRVARTMVEVAFSPTATVGQLDSVLSAVRGRIVGSLAHVAILEVQIPDSRTLAGLHAVISRLERARGVVRYVNEAVMSSGDALPSNISPTSNADLQKVAGSLAINAPAAWNAAGAIDPANRPTVVVGDNFGGGVPDRALDAEGLTASMFAIGGSKDQHGYAVAGVIAGSFGGDSSGRGQVTGVFPATTRMSVVDAELVPASLFQDGLIQAIKAAPGNVVVNTSRNDCASTDTVQVCPSGATLHDLALAWIEKVRGTGSVGVAGAGLEGRFLQATSAGNIRRVGPTDSQSNSAYDAAHELTGLREPGGTPVPPLSNVLTVEGDFAEDPASVAPGIDCLDATSKRPGDISAVGDVQSFGGLWTLTGAMVGAGPEGGTSFATPQVAAVAEYVWTLEPRLSPQQLAQLLKDTAQAQLAFLSADPGCDQNAAPAPAIDAYQALLSIDTTQLPLPGTDQPVRTALLDSSPVPGKHEFREDDLADFIFHYLDLSGNPVAPTTPDFSRWDLNGDGFTGGPKAAPFDLDRTGSTLWGKPKLTNTVTQSILGLDVGFDEKAATDLDVLCYYAYSPLYLGDTQFRDSQLGPHCLPKVKLGVNFPSTAFPGTATPLTVDVSRLDFPAQGQSSPQPGVRIELSATGGTVDAASGTTDSAGGMHANATLASAAAPLKISIVARAGKGGPILASTTVTAVSGRTAQVDIMPGTTECVDNAGANDIANHGQPDLKSTTSFDNNVSIPFTSRSHDTFTDLNTNNVEAADASATDNCNSRVDISGGSVTYTLHFDGSGSASLDGKDMFAGIHSSGDFRPDFIVRDTVGYEINGTVTVSTDLDTISDFLLVELPSNTEIVPLVQSSAANPTPPFHATGTLAPGEYELLATGQAIADAQWPSPLTASASATLDVTLTLSPL